MHHSVYRFCEGGHIFSPDLSLSFHHRDRLLQNVTVCLQLLEILEIYWSFKTLLEILELYWNSVNPAGILL